MGKVTCLPMMPNLPKLPRPWGQRRAGASMYLCRTLDPLGIPKPDLRTVFCVNRGNVSCLPVIPLFDTTCVLTQMDDASKAFVSEFVHVMPTLNNSGVLQVTFPYCCRAIKRELNPNVLNPETQTLLKFVWQFMPKERGPVPKNAQLRFLKYSSAP